MYGRPAGSASSPSLWAFDNSIIPICFARSTSERRTVFLADPPVFRREIYRSAKTFEDPAGYPTAITFLPR